MPYGFDSNCMGCLEGACWCVGSHKKEGFDVGSAENVGGGRMASCDSGQGFIIESGFNCFGSSTDGIWTEADRQVCTSDNVADYNIGWCDRLGWFDYSI